MDDYTSCSVSREGRGANHETGRMRYFTALIIVMTGVLMVGCSAEGYRRAADRDAYRIIDARTGEIEGMDAEFRLPEEDIDRNEWAHLLGYEEPPETISLTEAIVLAVERNREFQENREELFIRALRLSSARHEFATRFSGILNGAFEKDRDERFNEGGGSLTARRALQTGGDISLSLSTSFLRFITGDPRHRYSSAIDLMIRQPLWRGAGRTVARDSLTQAEMDMIYQMRSFVRFKRSFYVSVASAYYRVLQQKDSVENEFRNYERLVDAHERAQWMAEAGRLPGFQVDQAEQDRLRARGRWISARESYEAQLDDFKIRLGIPIEVAIELDDNELVILRELELEPLDDELDYYAEAALQRRLDLLTARDRIDDAERRIAVAKNRLGPQFDLIMAAGIGSEPPMNYRRLTRDESGYSVGLQLDLPLDRLEARNQYRESFITLARSKRAEGLLHDRIVQQIRDTWRAMETTRENYDIQLMSVELAENRVENTGLMIEAGRASIRDLLEAQEAFVQAQNQLTRALVDYRVSLLELWRDMDSLAFEDGMFVLENTYVE